LSWLLEVDPLGPIQIGADFLQPTLDYLTYQTEQEGSPADFFEKSSYLKPSELWGLVGVKVNAQTKIEVSSLHATFDACLFRHFTRGKRALKNLLDVECYSKGLIDT
jgi:hypothetical protein